MIGIFITARLGSTRLPQKHLIEASGRPFIKWLAGRYLTAFNSEIRAGRAKVFITTSIEPQNQEFENVFKADDVSIFYGSDDNIPLRHLECAEANHVKYVISIDGDDILCSTTAAKDVVKQLVAGNDMVQTKGLPLGMNVMGYSTDFLKLSLKGNTQAKLETGWGKIFEKSNIEVINLNVYDNDSDLRMTLDYDDDAIFFKKVISHFGEEILTIDDKQLVKQIIENDWQKLNISLNDEYWDNFNKQKNEEN